ncbi:hypothetical protein QWA68_016893 [Fusarium oxysporum]|nr:hypothetical protein QWA68_016893 [Fusarium oxysporum]
MTAPLPSASQNAQGAQRPGVEALKQTASSVPDNPQTPVSLSATTPQGTMRRPQQPGSQGSATAAQNSAAINTRYEFSKLLGSSRTSKLAANTVSSYQYYFSDLPELSATTE